MVLDLLMLLVILEIIIHLIHFLKKIVRKFYVNILLKIKELYLPKWEKGVWLIGHVFGAVSEGSDGNGKLLSLVSLILFNSLI